MIHVSESIFRELDFLLISLLCGCFMVLVYDALRVFRRIVKHGTVWLAIEDMVYWISCALLIFAMLYQTNDGLIRGFAIGGIIIGMLLYNQLISPWAVRGLVWLIQKILRMISLPFRFAQKHLKKPAAACRLKILRFLRKVRKILKKIKKTVKIGLCKL